MPSLKALLILGNLVVGIMLLFILGFLQENANVYSLIYCSYFLFTLYTIWIIGGCKIQPYILFYLTFSLFIGGRFWANLLGYEGNIWNPTFFYSYSVNHERKIELLRHVIGFMCFSSFGYQLSRICLSLSDKMDFYFHEKTVNSINIFLSRSYLLFFVYVIWDNIYKLKAALESGYLSLYLGKQSNDYTAGSSLFAALLNVFLGLAMGYGDAKNRRKYLFLIILGSVFMIIIGARSAFGATLLMLLWIYAQYHKVSLKKLLILCACCLGLLLLVFFSLSLRVSESNTQFTDIWNILLLFLYDQGISLMVFDASKLIDSYPVLPYFTRFFPGITGLVSFFTGETYYPYDTSFSDYMCYQLNPQLFLSGQGLGWSILSDIYLLSFRIYPIFLLLSLGWGYLIGKLELWSEYSRFFKAYIYISISGLLMVPRASVAGIFPYIFYLLVLLFIIIFFIQLARIKNDRYSTSLGRWK